MRTAPALHRRPPDRGGVPGLFRVAGMAALLGLLTPGAGAAQDTVHVAQDTLHVAQDTLHVTLARLLSRIQTDHPAVQQGLAATNAAVARAASLGRLQNPLADVNRELITYHVSVLQPVPWPWEQRALHRLGAADVQVARAESDVGVKNASLDAATRFADALREREEVALAIQTESLAVLALNHALAARQFGQGGDLAALQARVSLDAARRTRVAAEQSSRAAVASVAIILGQPPENPLVLDGDLAGLLPLTDPDSALQARAVITDPELKRLSAVAIRADREASLARARLIPQLSTGPRWDYLSTTKSHRWSWGFEMDLPVLHFNGDIVKAAKSDRAASMAAHAARERELTAQMLDASSTRASAQMQLDSLRHGDLARAAQAESLAVQALQQGGPYFTIWLATHQAYLEAQRSALDLEWQAARARLLMWHLSGKLLEESEGAGGAP